MKGGPGRPGAPAEGLDGPPGTALRGAGAAVTGDRPGGGRPTATQSPADDAGPAGLTSSCTAPICPRPPGPHRPVLRRPAPGSLAPVGPAFGPRPGIGLPCRTLRHISMAPGRLCRADVARVLGRVNLTRGGLPGGSLLRTGRPAFGLVAAAVPTPVPARGVASCSGPAGLAPPALRRCAPYPPASWHQRAPRPLPRRSPPRRGALRRGVAPRALPRSLLHPPPGAPASESPPPSGVAAPGAKAVGRMRAVQAVPSHHRSVGGPSCFCPGSGYHPAGVTCVIPPPYEASVKGG